MSETGGRKNDPGILLSFALSGMAGCIAELCTDRFFLIRTKPFIILDLVTVSSYIRHVSYGHVENPLANPRRNFQPENEYVQNVPIHSPKRRFLQALERHKCFPVQTIRIFWEPARYLWWDSNSLSEKQCQPEFVSCLEGKLR